MEDARISRTFKLQRGKKPMRGKDVSAWQRDVKKLFKDIGIDCPIKIDGHYGQKTRAFTAALINAYGMRAKVQMANGVTPELRIRLRKGRAGLTAGAKKTMDGKARKAYRARLREQWRVRKVHPPLTLITTDDWGFVPGVHDGIDVTGKRPGLPVFAMVKCKVVDVRMSDWWGKSPSGNVALGDGIVIVEILENVGPFKKGQHIGYGHTEQPNNVPIVKVGDVLEAGDQLGSLGLAVTPHIHLVLNNTPRLNDGIGNINPRAILDYSIKHG